MCIFSVRNALYERFFAIFAFRIRSFLDKEPIVFRILLKHHINNARMMKATKLTPYRRGH